jgi:hypothetical protein
LGAHGIVENEASVVVATKAAIVGAVVKVRLGGAHWQWSAGVTPAVPRSSERPAASRDHCEMGRPSGRLTARPSSSVRI